MQVRPDKRLTTAIRFKNEKPGFIVAIVDSE